MTTLDIALTNTERTNAALAHTIRTWMVVVAQASFATAQINQSSFTYPITQITVDNTPANWTSPTEGYMVMIGTTAGASDVGIYRLRTTPGATTLYLAETSEGDYGLLPGGIRTTALADNQYITIVSTWNFYSVLPLITGTTIYEDYNRTPSTFNTNPEPGVSVLINGEHNHYAGFTDSGQTYCTMVFSASNTLWPTSASVTYSWAVPASWPAPTAGATNTNTVTYRVPRSTTNYVVKLLVAENSVGQTQEREIMIWSLDKSGTYAPFMISDLSSDGWDATTGARFSFTLDNNLLASIPDGSMVHIFQEATFNGATIASAVTRFTGWLMRATKHGEPGLRSADCEFVGPAALLASRRGTSQIFTSTSGPSTWQQVPATLCSLSFAQWWMLRTRASNVLKLFDVNVYSTAAIGQRLPNIIVNKGNLWQQITSLADGIMKRNAGCDPDGTFWLGQPRPSLYAYANRGSIVKRDTLDASIWHDYELAREFLPQVGWVEGEAFYWDGTSAQPIPILSLAPGYAPGQGPNDEKVQGQVVTEQVDINTLTGNWHAYRNPDYSQGTINIQGNRGVLFKPAQMQMVRLQIPATSEPTGVAFDRYIIPTAVRRTYQRTDGGGIVVDTQITAEIETAGVAGVTKPVPASNSNLYATATVITPPTAITGGLAARGLYAGTNKIAGFGDDGYLYKTSNFQSASPTWTRTNLSVSGTPIKFVVDAYSPRYLNTGTQVNGWLITTTKIYRIADVFGTVTATLQHTFASGSSNTRTVDASFGVQNWVVVVTHYDGVDTRVIYTTDGGTTWTDYQLNAFHETALGYNMAPGTFVSPRTPGRVYTSAGTATGSTTAFAAAGFISADYGASFTQMTSSPLITLTDFLAQTIHVPYHDNASETLIYYQDTELATNTTHTMKSDAGVVTDVSPSFSGTTYGPQFPRSMDSCPINRQAMILVGFNGTNRGVWTTANGGTSWTLRVATGTLYLYCAAAGDNDQIFYVFGGSGAIAYLTGGGSVVSDKSGNIASFTPGNILSICGG